MIQSRCCSEVTGVKPVAKFTKAKDFAASLEDFARVEISNDIKRVKIAVALDLFRNLVLTTPVGNPSLWKNMQRRPLKIRRGRRKLTKKRKLYGYVGGTARASWFVTPTRPSDLPIVKHKPGSSNEGRIHDFQNSPVIWIANNLPYIERIMEEGWSTQSPPGTWSQVIERIRNKWGLR